MGTIYNPPGPLQHVLETISNRFVRLFYQTLFTSPTLLVGLAPVFLLDECSSLFSSMCTFVVAMDEGRRVMSSTVRLGHVAKYPFLMACRRVCRRVPNSVAWYHCVISGFVIAVRSLSSSSIDHLGWVHGLLVRLTFNTP